MQEIYLPYDVLQALTAKLSENNCSLKIYTTDNTGGYNSTYFDKKGNPVLGINVFNGQETIIDYSHPFVLNHLAQVRACDDFLTKVLAYLGFPSAINN